LNQSTDEELMQLVASGNLEKLRPLFDRYYRRIFNFVLKSTGDRELSQDVTQETFYKILKYRKTYQQRKFSTWIYTIAKNLCNDHYKGSHNQPVSLEHLIYVLEEPSENCQDTIERKEQLNAALGQLSLEDRQLLIMHRFQGIKYAELAEITNSTVGAVKTRTHRALQKLKEHYFKKVRHEM